jgi:hypothetical protein
MFPTATFTKRALALATLVLGMVAVSSIMPQTANASGERGRYGPAQVICNFYDHMISFSANLTIAPGYDQQTVAWRFHVVNKTTGQAFAVQNGNTGSEWFVKTHNRIQYLYDPSWNSYQVSYVDIVATGTQDLPAIAGNNYEVYTQYAWYSGFWVYSEFVKTTSYSLMYGLQNMSFCRT